MRIPSDKNLKWINRLLLGVIILCNAYVLITPILPKLTFWAQTKVLDRNPISLQPSAVPEIDRTRNRLIIPSLRLDQAIHEGLDERTVHRGIWHRPNTSSPDKGSNTVLVGHRFSYSDPAVFYNLDQVKTGEQIAYVHNQKIYVYTIKEIKIVSPQAMEVEAPTDENRLTIYTCAPLWSTRDRLVVTAELENVL